jgi:hypothetical protein
MTTLLDKFFGTFLGVEYKEDSIIVAYLKNSASGISLLSSSSFPLKDKESTANEVREYISQQGMDVNRVFVSIPDKWAIIKFTDIPSIKGKGRDAIANLMRFEIERHIPFNIDDVVYDFLVMSEKDKMYSVVFVAVQKERVDLVNDMLEKLALQPHAITISSFAVLNTIELSGVSVGGLQEVIGITRKSDILSNKDEINILLYIDKMDANLAIISKGLCTHIRTFVFDPGQPLDVFSDDIAKYLAEVRSRLSIEHFNKLIIAGDLSFIAGHIDELKENLGSHNVTIDQVSYFSGSLRGVEVNGLESSIGACFAGLGIGIYRINLLPHKKEYEITRTAPLATKIFLILILVLIVGIFTTEAVKKKEFLKRMEGVLKKNEPAIHALENLTTDINVLKARSSFLNGVKENEITLEILAELTGILPKDSWITNLNYKGFEIKNGRKAGGELIINGYADSSSTLIPLLEDSPYFEKVEFVGPIKKRRDKEQFKLSAQVVKPSDQESEPQE